MREKLRGSVGRHVDDGLFLVGKGEGLDAAPFAPFHEVLEALGDSAKPPEACRQNDELIKRDGIVNHADAAQHRQGQRRYKRPDNVAPVGNSSYS